MENFEIAVDEDYACLIEMCKAHDVEEAAQKGEPDPWEEGIFDDVFVEERVAAMTRAFMVVEAYLKAKRSAMITCVGEAGTMPGTGGFTMAAFKADEVPRGTKLFIPTVRKAALAFDYVEEME